MTAANTTKAETAKALYEQIGKEVAALDENWKNDIDRLNLLLQLTQCYSNVSDG